MHQVTKNLLNTAYVAAFFGAGIDCARVEFSKQLAQANFGPAAQMVKASNTQNYFYMFAGYFVLGAAGIELSARRMERKAKAASDAPRRT